MGYVEEQWGWFLTCTSELHIHKDTSKHPQHHTHEKWKSGKGSEVFVSPTIVFWLLPASCIKFSFSFPCSGLSPAFPVAPSVWARRIFHLEPAEAVASCSPRPGMGPTLRQWEPALSLLSLPSRHRTAWPGALCIAMTRPKTQWMQELRSCRWSGSSTAVWPSVWMTTCTSSQQWPRRWRSLCHPSGNKIVCQWPLGLRAGYLKGRMEV